MSCTRVDLAEPVPPITPTVMPLLMWRSMSRRFHFSEPSLYLKDTWSKSTEPSATVTPGEAEASVMSGTSSRTSATRLAQAMARVIIIIIMDTIIRLMSTWVM